jgi:hypothetical protein
MAANSNVSVMAGEKVLSRVTSAPAPESIQESVLSPAEERLALTHLMVTVLLVVIAGVYFGTQYGVVLGLAAVVFASSVVAATVGLCAFVTGSSPDRM